MSRKKNGSGDDDATPAPVDPVISAAIAEALARAAEADMPKKVRRQAVHQLAVELHSGGFRDALNARGVMAWISDTLIEVAPRLPLRDLQTLRSHFPGLNDAQIANRIVRNAARTSAGIGAIGGGIAAVEWVVPPVLLTAPVVLAAETLAVVAVEVKMLAELQELYGQPLTGTTSHKALALVQAWADRRGVNLLNPSVAVTAVLGTAARRELRDRLARRFGRNLTSYGPLFSGAVIAAWLNRRATLKLAEEIRKDLTRNARRAVTQG
jgi:hypothetical protein